MDFFSQQPPEREGASRQAQGWQGQFKTVRELDPVKVQKFQERMQEEQNFLLGILAGGAAAVIGAILWAAVTYFTGAKIVWVAIGVGFMVGWAIRQFGRGVDKIFGILGAGLALGGCVLGNLFSLVILLAQETEISLYAALQRMISHPLESLDLFIRLSAPIDLLFYAFAIYYGYRYSIRQITREEEEGLYRTRTIIS